MTMSATLDEAYLRALAEAERMRKALSEIECYVDRNLVTPAEIPLVANTDIKQIIRKGLGLSPEEVKGVKT